MRKSIMALAAVATLTLSSVANAAVMVNSGSVVNLNNPDPSATNPVSSVQTVGDTTTINFGLNPITTTAGNVFSSAFTISDSASGIYSVNVGTSSDGVTFTSGTLTDVLTSTVYDLVVTDFGLGMRLGPPFTGTVSLAPGDYRLVVNGTATSGGSFDGTVTILAAVPEPATWAMMLLGFGAIGLSMRKRRGSRVSFAQVA
jgi:hypothetical protein